MTEPTNPASSAIGGFSLWIPVILVVYALSIGPVRKVFGNNRPPAAIMFLDTFYAPLQFLYDHVPPVEHFYDWYFKLFGFPAGN